MKLFILKSIFILFLFVSCSNNHGGRFIGITVYDRSDVFPNNIADNIENFLSGKVKYKIVDSQNDQTKQNEQISKFLEEGANVLVVNLVDIREAQNIIEIAKLNNASVIFYNKMPSASVMSSYDKAWFVGTFNEQAGEIQGDIVVKSWNDNPDFDKNRDGKMQVVILEGEPNNSASELRTKHVVSFINSQGIDVDILRQQTAMWSKNKAKNILDEWMTGSSLKLKVEYIIANSDLMALGALESIQGFKYNTQGFKYNTNEGINYIPIVGIDGISDTVKEMKNGNIIGTVINDYASQARAISDMALNIYNGLNPTDNTDWILENNKYIRIPYQKIAFDNN